MILEIARALSFFLSILCLYPVVLCAFFVPGSRWEDRLAMALAKVALAGCVCFLSGLLFSRPWRMEGEPGEHLLATLPVRMYLWTVLGVTILFMLSWYFEDSSAPWLWRNLP